MIVPSLWLTTMEKSWNNFDFLMKQPRAESPKFLKILNSSSLQQQQLPLYHLQFSWRLLLRLLLWRPQLATN